MMISCDAISCRDGIVRNSNKRNECNDGMARAYGNVC